MTRRRSRSKKAKAETSPSEAVAPLQGELLDEPDPPQEDPSAEEEQAEEAQAQESSEDSPHDQSEVAAPERIPGLDGERLQRAADLVADGRPVEAIDVYHGIIREHPDNLNARHNLGVLYDELGRHTEAIEMLEAARELEPANPEVLANLGAALAAMGRFDAADEHIKKAARLDPESISVRANLAILAFRRGLYEVAEAELQWVCERDPTHGSAHFYRGEALNRMGRVDEALDALEKTRELQPWNHRIFHTMGMLYDKKREPEMAADMYRRARESSRG
jgi:Flp pilus assembly protein TadD